MIKLLLSVFIIFMYSGCAGFPKDTLMLTHGDSKKEILKYYGEPDNAQFDGENEAWEYCKRGTSFGRSSFRTIWLYKGKVTGTTSYSQRGNCDFRPINWEDAPDYSIELRKR